MATTNPMLGLMLLMMSNHQGYTPFWGYAPSHGEDRFSPDASKELNLGTCKEYYANTTAVLDYLQVEYGCLSTQVEDRRWINFILETVLVFYGHLHYRPKARWEARLYNEKSSYGLLPELIELEVNSLNAESPFFNFEVVAKAFWHSATQLLLRPRDASCAQTEVSEISFVPPYALREHPDLIHRSFEYFEYLMREVTDLDEETEPGLKITSEFIDTHFRDVETYCKVVEDVFEHIDDSGWRREVWTEFYNFTEEEFDRKMALELMVLEARDWEESDEYDAIAALDDLLSSISEVKA